MVGTVQIKTTVTTVTLAIYVQPTMSYSPDNPSTVGCTPIDLEMDKFERASCDALNTIFVIRSGIDTL